MSSGSHHRHHRRLPRRKEQIEWRRSKILELMSKGENNQSEIARILQIDRSIVCRDLAYFRQHAKGAFKTYLDERLPEEYEKCFVGLRSILKEAWGISIRGQKREDTGLISG
jgi:DNA-binding transcriptional regulator LsrR (DeoR family)